MTFNAEELAHPIASIFDQIQSSIATHKKNCISLYKYHAKALLEVTKTRKGKSPSIDHTGEKAFNEIMLSLINRALTIKKGALVADKVIKFLGVYIHFLGEKCE